MSAPSAGLRVVRSAEVAALVPPLAASLRATPADPFVPLRVAVASRGMERWLSHQLAQALDPGGRGVTANVAFPFPGAVVADAVAAVGVAPADPGWAPTALAWRILAVLHTRRDDPVLARLVRVLPSDGDHGTAVDRRAWGFARAVADVLDRYTLFRPEVLAAWLDGDDRWSDGTRIGPRDRWQPHLWRLLCAELGDPTAPLRTAMVRWTDPAQPLTDPDWQAGIRVFGLAGLPPRHLALLRAVAARVAVELYLHTVAPARWDVLRTGPGAPGPSHPLLVAGARIAEDAARLVLAQEPDAEVVVGRDVSALADPTPADPAPADPPPPGSTRLLAAIQADLRDDRPPGSRGRLPHEAAADGSLQVHRCHGPTRQAEVLRDVLLGLLADDPSLEPRDVLVMTPDVDRFAPLVQAAFAGTPEVPALPVRVADRALGRSDPAAETLLAVLALAGGRRSASQVLDLLGRDPVALRFGLSPDDLTRIATWIGDTGVRWGIDADDRVRHGQPPDDAHTWQAGLDRLLLGVAMPDEDQRLVEGVRPYDHVEGSDVELAGRLAAALHTVAAVARTLHEPRPLAAWTAALDAALTALVALPASETWRLARARTVLSELGADAGEGAAGLRVELPAVTALVAAALDRPPGAAGYETGSVTLCAMVPMRSIPHRVIAVLGLDDGAFPRRGGAPGFDLTERDHLPGDRDRRDEDRLLLLEAVLAARDHLVITSTGWDPRSGEERPAAVPLAELLDVVDRTAGTDVDPPARAAVVTDHPLLAVSPRSFGVDTDGRPAPVRGFDPAQLAAAEASRLPQRRWSRFLDGPLPPAPLPAEVSLAELTAAIAHPTRSLLRRRLGLHLREQVVTVADREPLTVDGLTAARVGRELLATAEVSGTRTRAALLATGVLPVGTPGHVELGRIDREIAAMRAEHGRILALLGAGPADLDPDAAPDRDPAPGSGLAEDVRIDLDLDGRRLGGTLPAVRRAADGRRHHLRIDFVRPAPRQLLQLWIEHLALTATGDDEVWSWWVLRPASGDKPPTRRCLGPLDPDPGHAAEAARRQLTDLLALHDEALLGPLLLFERASHAFAAEGKLAAAGEAFLPGWGGFGGDVDEDVAQAYGAEIDLDTLLADPDDEQAFRDLARRVWEPVLLLEASTPDRPAPRGEETP